MAMHQLNSLSMSETRPTISACLIVKNEERLLAQCLDSIKDIVDEIIIVDTGSSDQTLEIARQYTNKLIQHPWNDHFSEARNVSLKHATGDWILIIDADEMLPKETARLIPAYLNRPEFQNKPLVLNWLVTSELHQNLYSRGLFPNGYGIHFSGRVHEIPVLPDQILPAYNCEQLVIKHESPGGQDETKQLYYKKLLMMNLAEASEPRLINHIQKHLGLCHLNLAEWQDGWDMLSSCYKGMSDLGIEPHDGFYCEVVDGLVRAEQSLKQATLSDFGLLQKQQKKILSAPITRLGGSKRFKKALIAGSMSLLAACQSVPSRTNPSVPGQVNHTTTSTGNDVKSQWGDFGIKAAYFCPQFNYGPQITACYAAGGHPVVGQQDVDQDGYLCFHYDHCDMPTPHPTPTPEPTSTPSDCIEEPGGPPCVILPGGGGATPTPSPSVPCEFQGQSIPAEDKIVLPHKLEEPIAAIVELAPPMFVDDSRLGSANEHYSNMLKEIGKLKTFNYPINELILEPKLVPQNAPTPDPTLKPKQKEKVMAALNGYFQSRANLNQFESLETEGNRQRRNTNQQLDELFLENLGNDTRFTKVYSKPFSLLDYDILADDLQADFQAKMEGKNTVDLSEAMNVIRDELKLYSFLYEDYLSASFIGESQSDTRSPGKILAKLKTQATNHIARVGSQFGNINNQYAKLIQNEFDAILRARTESTRLVAMMLLDSGVINPSTLEVYPQYSEYINEFSIQSLGRACVDNLTGNTLSMGNLMNCFEIQMDAGLEEAHRRTSEFTNYVSEGVGGFLNKSQGTLDALNHQIDLVVENPVTHMMLTAYLSGPQNYLRMSTEERRFSEHRTKEALKTFQEFYVPQKNFDLALMAVTGPGNKGKLGLASIRKLDEFLDVLIREGKYSEGIINKFRKMKQGTEEALARATELERICKKKGDCREFISKHLLDYQSFNDDFKKYLVKKNHFENLGGTIPFDLANEHYIKWLDRAKNAIPQNAEQQAIKDWILENIEKYSREGVKAKTSGFPDFHPYAFDEIDISDYVMTGDEAADFKYANEQVAAVYHELGLIAKPSAEAMRKFMLDYGLTWHHHENLRQLQLVPQAIHLATQHSGSNTLVREIRAHRPTLADYEDFIGEAAAPNYFP